MIEIRTELVRQRAAEAGHDSAYAIAQQLRVSASTISRWLAGDIQPSLTTLVAVRDLYGISLDELVISMSPTDDAVIGAAA